MKTPFIHTLFAAALLSLGACSKPDNSAEKGPEQKPEEPIVEKNLTAIFSTDLNESMDRNLMYTINNGLITETAEMGISEDGKSAGITITVPKTFIAPYEFGFATPLATISKYNKDNRAWVFDIPSTQEPGVGVADPAARVFAAWTDAMDEIPTETINLEFHPVTAYGKVNITNLPVEAGAVSRITLGFAAGMVGRFQYIKGEMVEKLISNVITLTTASVEGVCFGCAPADLKDGNITVTVSAEGGDYTRSFSAAGSKLEAGKTAEFNFDFTGVHSSLDRFYTMATSESELKDGDEVIIVCTANSKAVSTVQNAKNRGAADISFEEDGSVRNPAENVQTLTVTIGDGKIAFHTGTTYMGPQLTADNCYLQEIEALEDAWLTLSIDENGDTAMCKEDYTLKYYGKNNVFNMFLPSTGKAVQIYKKN